MRRCKKQLLFLLLLFVGLAPAQQTRSLTILHTNDLHARFLPDGRQRGGFTHVAQALRREKANCNSCLVLNGGDLVQGSPVSTIYRGVPIYEVANLLGFDVSTLGNHEFDYGWRMIPRFLRKARFPIVSANVVDSRGRLLAPQAYTIRNVNGIRVAVIGVLTADLPSLSTPDLLGPWRVLPVLETVRRYAAEVRDRADLIVTVAHINPDEEDQILREAPEIAVVVSGHVHRGLEYPKQVDGRIAVRVRAFGEEIGRLELQVDLAAKKVVSSSWRRIEINANAITPAEDVAALVAKWEAKVAKIVDVPIGEAKREYSRADLKVLMEQAMAASVGADLAFMNEGGIRDFFPKGRLLARHAWNVMPFDNKVVMGKFAGSQLPAAVTNGRMIDPERQYTLAVNDFTAANQKTELGVENLAFPVMGRLQRDVLIDFIKKKKILE